MSRSAFHGRARGGGRALASMLLAIGGLASCGPGQQDAADAASAVVAQAIPPDRAECRRWTTCVPENPCHTGWVTGCRKNEPICTDIGGWLSNGTTCGTDAVCYMGECEACAAGQSCPINGMYGTPDPCKAGQIFCDTGQPVCKEVGPAPDGTYCGYEGGGSPYVCKGGQCTWCMEGTSCTPPEKPCHQGTVAACATTGGTCVDSGAFLPNGTWCEYYTAVCRDGECAACAQGSACTPQEPCMESGWTDCSSGWPVCIPNMQKPDGTPCEGGVCQGGQCRTPCVPDQPCTPYNACYGGRTVCLGPYDWYCEQVAPLPDGTGCGDSQVCRAGSCTWCGAGSSCQPPDPCYGAGTLSCATGQCSPAGDAYANGWTCGFAGETCQAGICTDDTDPRLVIGSAWGALDVTGTTWSRCVAAGAGLSRRITETFGLGTGTRLVESFATPDCSGDVQATTGGDRTFTSSGNRYVGWTGAPPGGLQAFVTATALHVTGSNVDGTSVDLKTLYWVNDWVTPRQLFRGDPSKLGADGYPISLVPEPNPFTQVLPPCIAGQPCTSGCYAGVTVCWDAYNGYCEQREPLPDGSSCGTDLVCSGGGCVPCGPAAWCQSSDPCYASGTISCATGSCEPQPPPYGDGFTCGVGGETCQGGTCTPVPGADPWIRSTDGVTYRAVDLAGTTWSGCIGDEPGPGMSRLRVDTYVAGGITHREAVFTSSANCTGPTDPGSALTIAATITSGGDRLASWEGGYVPPGLPYSPTATGMDVSAPESPLGPIHFKEIVLVHDGVSPRQLYRGESKTGDAYPSQLKGSMPMTEVLACNAGDPCNAGYPTCEVHQIDCATGAPICAGTGTFVADGTRCADGHSWCQTGACVPVPTRTVTGTAWMTYWPDAGPVPTAEPVPLVSIAAVQAPGPTYYPGYLYGDGTFQIPNVEEGPYQLEIQTQSMLSYVSTTSSTIDLGVDVLGRQYLAWAAAPTPVLFDVDGLSPWALGDVLEFASSNAGVAEFPFGLPNLITGPVGTTQLYGTFDWNGRPLVDAGAGDVAYVFQGSTTTDPAIGRVTTASGWAAIPPPPDFAIAEGLGGTVDVTLGPCPWAGAVTADWRRSAFEGYVPLVHPNATARNHRIVVGARPHDAALAPPFRSGNFAQFAGGLPLLIVQSDPGAGDVSLAGLPYGQFLPPPWREYRHDRVQVGVPFTAPGATASASLGSPLGYDIAAASAPSVVTPMIAPPGSLTINGADAWSGLVGVGTSPRIAWTAPAVSPEAAALFPGASLLYRVAVYEVRLTPAGGTQVAFLFEGRTTRTSYRLPGTGLVPGGRYVVAIEASLAAESLDAPLRRARERAYATVVSSEFIP